jgi:glycosyltransferase involved in cell wall biosynthesis
MALESIVPYVDESLILIDDRTTDATREIAQEYGCRTLDFRFENFAKARNKMIFECSGDWVFSLDLDEWISIDFVQKAKSLIEQFHNTPIESIHFPRRHWYDLEMTKERKEWYPDWICRIWRKDFPRIHFINYVHEVLIGYRKTIHIKEDTHHLNCYWKPRIFYDWEKMNKLYADLAAKQRQDGGRDIWP